MALNKIFPFADTASGGNILTDTAYSTDAQRSIGHQPGIARQELANKQARQSSVIAAGVAQFLADNQSIDVVDTLTPAQIATMLYGVSSKIFNSDDVLTTGRALTANDINKHFIFNNTLPQTFDLPPVNSIPSGSVIYVRGGQAVATFNRSGADTINVTNVGTGITSCTCLGSEVIMLVSNSGGDWRLTKINPRYQYSNLTANRAYNTTYTNQTGFELEVFLTFNPPNATNTSIFPYVNGESILGEIHNNTISRGNISFRVPAFVTYRIDVANLPIVHSWVEYVAVI